MYGHGMSSVRSGHIICADGRGARSRHNGSGGVRDRKAGGVCPCLTTSSKQDIDRGFTRQCSTVNVMWAVSAHLITRCCPVKKKVEAYPVFEE
jgi:hypothetical protein